MRGSAVQVDFDALGTEIGGVGTCYRELDLVVRTGRKCGGLFDQTYRQRQNDGDGVQVGAAYLLQLSLDSKLDPSDFSRRDGSRKNSGDDQLCGPLWIELDGRDARDDSLSWVRVRVIIEDVVERQVDNVEVVPDSVVKCECVIAGDVARVGEKMMARDRC